MPSHRHEEQENFMVFVIMRLGIPITSEAELGCFCPIVPKMADHALPGVLFL